MIWRAADFLCLSSSPKLPFAPKLCRMPWHSGPVFPERKQNGTKRLSTGTWQSSGNWKQFSYKHCEKSMSNLALTLEKVPTMERHSTKTSIPMRVKGFREGREQKSGKKTKLCSFRSTSTMQSIQLTGQKWSIQNSCNSTLSLQCLRYLNISACWIEVRKFWSDPRWFLLICRYNRASANSGWGSTVIYRTEKVNKSSI